MKIPCGKTKAFQQSILSFFVTRKIQYQLITLYFLIVFFISAFLFTREQGTEHLFKPKLLKEDCSCNQTLLPKVLHDNPPLECIGAGGNFKPLPDRGWGNQPTCFRIMRNFYRALAGENVPVVPQFGTFLRWYRDCEMVSVDDHDVDIGIFAQHWNRVNWSNVYKRAAWLHFLEGDFYAAYHWLTDYIAKYNIETTTINGVESPTKIYLDSAGGIPDCALDLWVMYHQPITKMNWRCLPSWDLTYVYGPVETYQKIIMNGIPGAYAPTNTEKAVAQTFGSKWSEKVRHFLFYAWIFIPSCVLIIFSLCHTVLSEEE